MRIGKDISEREVCFLGIREKEGKGKIPHTLYELNKI